VSGDASPRLARLDRARRRAERRSGAGRRPPAGNFTINRLDVVSVSQHQVDVHWVLDQAEIPTFRERTAGGDGARPQARRRAAVAEADRRRRPAPLRLAGPGRIAFPAGQGGLHTTRVELDLTARVDNPRTVGLRDASDPGRLGWRSIVVVPGDGTAVRSDAPSQDVTRGLRAYPKDLLSDPASVRSASLRVSPGHGTVTAPRARGAGLQTTRGTAATGLRRCSQTRQRGAAW
jgi:hypothetical protein